MKRDIRFTGKGQLAEALADVNHEKLRAVERKVMTLLSLNGSIQDIVNMFNEQDMTDAEWTASIFALGAFVGQDGKGGRI